MVFVFYVNWIPQAIPNDLFPALTWPYWALPYIFLGWTAIGVAWYFIGRPRSPSGAAGAPPSGGRGASRSQRGPDRERPKRVSTSTPTWPGPTGVSRGF